MTSTSAAIHDERPADTTERQSTAERVAAMLRADIVHCVLAPGDILSEAEISRRYGVSRQPVREAIIRLVAAGLLAVRPQSGTRVTLIDTEAIRAARFVREAVEVKLVRQLARRGLSRREAAGLRAILARQARRGVDGAEFLALDEAFHRGLAQCLGMGRAWDMIDAVKAQMDRVRFLSVEELHMRRLIGHHRAILDAITAGDEDGAAKAMEDHLSLVLGSLAAIAQRNPALFAQDGVPLTAAPTFKD